MIEKVRHLLHKHQRWLPFALGAAGFLLYAYLSWHMSRRLATLILDESMYVYKGYLFSIGKYVPYQDYGPSTNHMPLAFMIPGMVQAWFGPGLATARAFAFFTGLVMLAGLWLAFYRLGGSWWAAGVVWLYVLSPYWQEIFSQGLTQGIVNAFLAWSFVLLIGKERRTWQLILAVILGVLATLTRINIAPVVALMVVYIFWQHGWKKGGWVVLTGALVGVGVLALFWPGVLKFISGWLPEGVFSFVEPFRSPWSQQHLPDGFSYFPLSAWWGDRTTLQWSAFSAVYETINVNFIPVLAAAGTLLFWPKKEDWPSNYRMRLSVFLSVTWWLMAAMHAWVALSGTSCRFFCMSGYYSFFNILALLLLPAALPYWRKELPVWRQGVSLGVLFALVTAALHHAGYRPVRVGRRWYHFMDTPIPRFKNGAFIEGETGPLRSVFESKLGLSYDFLVEKIPEYLYWLLPIVLVLVLVPWLHRLLKKPLNLKVSVPWFGFAAFLMLAVTLAPTTVFYKDTPNLVCDDDVVATHEVVGAELSEILPGGAKIYWDVTSNMLLLYLPQVEIFPQQLNTGFNYVRDADPADSDEISRFSYWDDTLDGQWIAEADYIVVSGERLDNWKVLIDDGLLQVVDTTSSYEECRPSGTQVYVLKRSTED